MSQMSTSPIAAPLQGAEDTEFVRFWNEVLAPKFIRFKHILVDGLSRHSEVVFPDLPVRPGDRVLDVGCGFGDTAIRLADMVGEAGQVIGVDCCDAFLDQARAEVRRRNLANVCFVRADAERELPVGQFDFVFARFGTMFFANPVAGLRNMRGALRPGGRMVHIVWRERADNPWLSMARDVVLRFLPPPGEDARTCGPGPFSMADQDMVRAMMRAAGYERIEFRRVDAPVLVGRDVQDAIAFQLAIGPAGEVFREAGALAEARRAEIEAALAAAIEQQKRAVDGVVMDSSSWVISAINPED
ncbi:MAG: methyltransferase domain-containing protein [Alphaproteobacteria bacterium]|nr:methyltransferase domain-containing protein [Alphaproteobacteria bacterium]